MGRLWIWPDANASSSYMALQRKINTHLLLSTSGAAPWDLRLKVFRHRTDLKLATNYDAIAEALESTLIDGVIEASVAQNASEERLLFLAAWSAEPGTVHGCLQGGQAVVLADTTLLSAEQIFVPKKDPDYRLRQTVKVEGIQLPQIKAGLVQVGVEAAALWLEVMDTQIDAATILPPMEPPYYDCVSMLDYVSALRSSRLL